MTLNYFWLLCSLIIGIGVPLERDDHAIYISVIKIKHEEKQATATIGMRVFADDLKDVLRNKFGYEAIVDKPTFCQDYKSLLQQYFKKGFVCTINEERSAYQLIRCEKLEEVYQLEFEMDCPTNWDSIAINAPFFMELFPNQSNIVHLESGATKRFGRATKGKELLRIKL